MAYQFHPVAVIDPVTNEPVRNAEGRIYATDDTEYATPLFVVDAGGSEGVRIATDSDGVIPPFRCSVPFVRFVFGDNLVVPLASPFVVAQPKTGRSRYEQKQGRGRGVRIARRTLLGGLATATLVTLASTAGDNPIDVSGQLQEILDSQPAGSTVFVPTPEDGAHFYLSEQLTIPEGITLQGASPQRNLNQNWKRGGAVFSPLPGSRFVEGTGVLRCRGARSQLRDISVVADSDVDYAVLDESTDSVHSNLSTFGGRVASYDGTNAKRIRLEAPAIKGLSQESVALRLGLDSQMIGGTKNSGILQFASNSGQVVGAHLTGGAPNVDVYGDMCQLSGCILDSAFGVALLRVREGSTNFSVTGVQFFQAVNPPAGQVPAVAIGWHTSGVMSSCTVTLGRVRRLPYFIRFSLSDPGRWNLSTMNIGQSVVKLWDRQPGHFVGVLGPSGRYFSSLGNT